MPANNIALILIDYQEDFCDEGALPVPGTRALLPEINAALRFAVEIGWPVFLTRDWHPMDHESFSVNGGPWPVHCVQHTPGARWTAGLNVPDAAVIISKGRAIKGMGYSPFEDDTLNQQLNERKVETLVFGGVALDYCVKEACIDARKLGYTTCVVRNLVQCLASDPLPTRTKLTDQGCVLVDTIRDVPST